MNHLTLIHFSLWPRKLTLLSIFAKVYVKPQNKLKTYVILPTFIRSMNKSTQLKKHVFQI